MTDQELEQRLRTALDLKCCLKHIARDASIFTDHNPHVTTALNTFAQNATGGLAELHNKIRSNGRFTHTPPNTIGTEIFTRHPLTLIEN